MKKSELKQIIKEELKSILKEEDEPRLSDRDIYGVVSSFLSDMINKNFIKYNKNGSQVQPLKISGLSGSGAHRSTDNTITFTIEPKDLKMPPVTVTLTITADMRKYNLFRNKNLKGK